MENIQATELPPLETVSSPAVDTAAAAYYLGRKPKTLRAWSSAGTGPIRPIDVNGRLSWPVSELRRVLRISPTSEG